jgi:hypothetical protein
VLFRIGELNWPDPLSIGVWKVPEPTSVTEHPACEAAALAQSKRWAPLSSEAVHGYAYAVPFDRYEAAHPPQARKLPTAGILLDATTWKWRRVNCPHSSPATKV